ncbi:MBL fold metallo-hydrolase [Conexibacter sp. SYSU D00693]|uniref:MBL fold metallo-hydrolase n=1 Tax=Conexibacter sp. SYSU D00693 TaxID=2812560 RepID=UPI00196B7BCA|nr:MBL fold metallo-hydrolase [Conexibacter sp. SYSU D00693]
MTLPAITTSPPPGFASTADLTDKPATLDEIVPGVLAYTAEGDPNVGAIVTPDGIVAVDARATPAAAQPWLDELRQVTDVPVRHLVLTHFHAVRVLGASAFGAREVVASEATRELIRERGAQDWESEFRRMPRLAKDPGSVPGLTWPTVTFCDRLTLRLGGRTVQLRRLGRGHTGGDIVVWLPDERVLFAGDLVEAGAALYMGDAHVEEWRTRTLDAVAAMGARALVPGRGPVVRGDDVGLAIEESRRFLTRLRDAVARARDAGADLRQAFGAAHEAMAPHYGDWPIFEHCLPFNVKRVMDELDGRPPAVWTAETDAAVWHELSAPAPDTTP